MNNNPVMNYNSLRANSHRFNGMHFTKIFCKTRGVKIYKNPQNKKTEKKSRSLRDKHLLYFNYIIRTWALSLRYYIFFSD